MGDVPEEIIEVGSEQQITDAEYDELVSDIARAWRVLNTHAHTGADSRVLYGPFRSRNFASGQSGWLMDDNGESEFHNTNIGGKIVVVPPGGSIHSAIDLVNDAGGGEVRLLAGTHTITTAISGISGLKIIGQGESNTTIECASSSANVSFAGTRVYTTGNIASITSGTAVVGTGTTWLSNITTNHQLFLGTRWYRIASIDSDTTLTLADAYGDSLSFPHAYRAAIPAQDIVLSNFRVQNSTGTGFLFNDCRQVVLDNVGAYTNNLGISFTNCSELSPNAVISAGNTTYGLELSNCGVSNLYQISTIGNGSHGTYVNNFNLGSFNYSTSAANTGDGYNCTSVTNTLFNVSANSNGGEGIEFVTGCNYDVISGSVCYANVSDGARLTASSSRNIINSSIFAVNTQYGVTISAASCSKNLIHGNQFDTNTAGTISDSGTSTTQADNVT